MATVQTTFQPFETTAVVPSEVSLSGKAKENVIVARQTGVELRPTTQQSLNLGSGGQTISFRLTSAQFLDLNKARFLCNVAVDQNGAGGASIIENFWSMVNNVRVTVGGVEAELQNFACASANMSEKLANSDYLKSQGSLNGDFVSALGLGGFTGMGANIGAVCTNVSALETGTGLPICGDLSFLGLFAAEKLFPARYMGALQVDFVMNSAALSCVDYITAGNLQPDDVTLSNIRLRYDEVTLHPLYIDALDRYLSDPMNAIHIPFNTYQTQRVGITNSSSQDSVVSVSRRYVKDVIVGMRDSQANSQAAAPKWSSGVWRAFGQTGQRINIGAIQVPQLIDRERAGLAAYSAAGVNAWSDGAGYGQGIFGTYQYQVPNSLANMGATGPVNYFDLIQPTIAGGVGVRGSGVNLTNHIVFHTLEAPASTLSDDELTGLNTSALGATLTLHQEFAGTGASDVPPTTAELYAVVRYGAMLRLRGNRIDVISV
jgi:hypothetical protein